MDSHGQSYLSHGTMGYDGQWDMGVLRWDSGLPWTVPPVPWYSGIGQWDMGALRWDCGLPWTVPPDPWYSGIGQTVGYGGPQVGQWTPMESPTCHMVQCMLG